jgi:hypothetical protein
MGGAPGRGGALGVYSRPNRPKAGKHEVSHFCNRPKTRFIRPKRVPSRPKRPEKARWRVTREARCRRIHRGWTQSSKRDQVRCIRLNEALRILLASCRSPRVFITSCFSLLGGSVGLNLDVRR